MEQYHHKIDTLRKAGETKNAIDLARFAYSKTPNHRLLKKSYAWAIYSHLKVRSSSLVGPLSGNTLDAEHKDVIAINALCREYRKAQLPTRDLCFSLILKRLSDLSVYILGLYELMKWGRSAGLRPEDYALEEDSSAQLPLIISIAERLEGFVSALDQASHLRTEYSYDVDEIALFTFRVHLHLFEREAPLYDLHRIHWSAGWLARRAGQFNQGIELLLSRFFSERSSPEVIWELSQCVAEEAVTPPALLWEAVVSSVTPVHFDHKERLRDARALATYSARQARGVGISELTLSDLYARVGYWSALIDEPERSRAMLSWATEVRLSAQVEYPYAWSVILDQVGGPLRDPWTILKGLDEEGEARASEWISRYGRRFTSMVET